MAAEDFIQGLKTLGYNVQFYSESQNKVFFEWTIPSGRFSGQIIKLGFEANPDFPLNPPHGPHFSPKLLPINTDVKEHPDRVHKSSFGPEWAHWSRPFPDWAESDRSVKQYMRYIEHLFGLVQ